MIDIILASKSPFRKEMLEKRKIPFEVIVSNADETPDESKSYEEQLKDISKRKAMKVLRRNIIKGKKNHSSC